MSTASVNRGQEFMGRHPLLTRESRSPSHRAHIRQLESTKLTVGQFYAERRLNTLRAAGAYAKAGIHIVGEFVEKIFDNIRAEPVGSLATAQAVEIFPAAQPQPIEAPAEAA